MVITINNFKLNMLVKNFIRHEYIFCKIGTYLWKQQYCNTGIK